MVDRNKEKSQKLETITLGGGCFWCTEAVFNMVKGVIKVIPGYSGGMTVNPTYKQVSTGKTGHAEVVQITFDPAVISLREILEIFFVTHDPTSLNRQGADVGTQYRSVIFYHTDKQRKTAERLILDLNQKKQWKKPIVTQLVRFSDFYEAEQYHFDYYESNKNESYCRIVIAPKLSKLIKNHEDQLKNSPSFY